MGVVISRNVTLVQGDDINENNPLIGWEQLADTGNISATSEVEGFPASNLVNPSTVLRWEAVDTGFQYLSVNDALEEVDYIAIARHNLATAQIPVSVEALGTVDAFTKVLLHFDGSDGSTNFTDSSPNPKTFAGAGNAQLDTADRRFNSASLLLDGTGDAISTPDDPDFALGSGDWTVEAWFKVTAAGGTERAIIGQTDASATAAGSSFDLVRTTGNVIRGRVSDGSTFTSVTGTTPFTDALNTGWHHVALERSGNVLRLFIDGEQEGGDVAFTGSVPNSGGALGVGSRGGGVTTSVWQGWLDEVRLSVGVARFGGEFSTAPAEYPWAEVVAPVILPDDGPALFRFEPQAVNQVRLRLQSGLEPATIAVMYVGKLLVLQRRIYVGHRPAKLNRRRRVTNARSEAGAFLGRIVTGESTQTAVRLQNLTPAWYRTYFDPFADAAAEQPFFFAWRPGAYPYEVVFGWLPEDIAPENQSPNGMMQVEFEIGAILK